MQCELDFGRSIDHFMIHFCEWVCVCGCQICVRESWLTSRPVKPQCFGTGERGVTKQDDTFLCAGEQARPSKLRCFITGLGRAEGDNTTVTLNSKWKQLFPSNTYWDTILKSNERNIDTRDSKIKVGFCLLRI